MTRSLSCRLKVFAPAGHLNSRSRHPQLRGVTFARASVYLRVMPTFDLQLPFALAGDQPQAIRELTEGLERGDPYQTLLGVTGSGKTVTMASVIAAYG